MRFVASTAALILAARSLLAPWPDGSPAPGGRRAAAPPDPGRIAVFPCRVTTADSLLGEGVAELVAGEFTGAGGPKATHMGTTLRVWRRAGGGLRTPDAQRDRKST